MFDFGLRIKELRESKKMSQEELGRRIGRSKPVISNYENNIKTPPLDVLINIAIVFNVSLDYLVGIDKVPMISIAGLSNEQKSIIMLLLDEFSNKETMKGLSLRQQKILSKIMLEFSK